MRRLALVLCFPVLAACVASPTASPPASPAVPPPPTAAGGFNDTDVMFLQMMIPHHYQGIALVRIGATRAERPEITMLAAAIESTQTGEAETMAEWLRTWAQPAAAAPDAHAAHGGMPGTSEAEMTALRQVETEAFERAFLNAMIAHQDDAVQLARMQTSGGVNPEVLEHAQRIDLSRTAQIDQMLALLGDS